MFYQDLGNIYNFGNETNDLSDFQTVAATVSPLSIRVLEQGPLRARVEAQVAFSDEATGSNASSAIYTLEYVLIADEPLVRMAVTGTAPSRSIPPRRALPIR